LVIRSFCGTAGGGTIKHLYVAENPLCQISNFILKSYIATTIPQIESFNGMSITCDEKKRSSNVFKRILGYSAEPPPSPAPAPVPDKTTHLLSLSLAPPLLEDRSSSSSQSRCSLNNSNDSSGGQGFQENAWTNDLYDRSEINYYLQLLENNYNATSSELDVKKPLDSSPPPAHSNSSFPSVGADPKKSAGSHLTRTDTMQLKRGDFEYRFPYKSSSTLQQVAPLYFTSVALLLPTQQTSLTSVADITQLVLRRRNMEEKFCKVRVYAICAPTPNSQNYLLFLFRCFFDQLTPFCWTPLTHFGRMKAAMNKLSVNQRYLIPVGGKIRNAAALAR
jgi:hypothetical protein